MRQPSNPPENKTSASAAESQDIDQRTAPPLVPTTAPRTLRDTRNCCRRQTRQRTVGKLEGLGEVAPNGTKCVINKETRDLLTLPKDSCLCTVRLGLSSGSRKYIEIPVLLDPGSCHRALIDQHTAYQLIRMGIPEEQLSPPHLTISGYDGGSRQRISSQISPVLSVPGTRFHDSSIPMSIVELSNRPYKAIIGWPYIQDKHIAIDGDCPLARFPQNRNQENPVPDQPSAKLVSPLRLRHLVKELGPGCLGVAIVSNEVAPIDFIEAEVAALSQADFAINEEVLKRPKVDPSTLLPKDYHDYLDLCTPYRKKPCTNRKFKINLKPDANIHKDIGYSPLRSMSDAELGEVKRVLDEHREAGNISLSSAPVASPCRKFRLWIA